MSDRMNEYLMPNNVEEYVTSSVQTFLGDPPDTEFQRGFLAAMLIVAKDALRLRRDIAPFAQAEKLMRKRKR